MRIVEGVALALVLAVPPLVFACGSGSDATPPVDAGSDTGVDAAPPPPPVDAGPDIEQPPNVYPSSHMPIPQLDNLGGPVLDHMKLVTVTFFHTVADAGAPDAAAAVDAGDGGVPGRDPDPWRESLRSFDDFIVKSDWWHQAMNGYGVGDGTGGQYGELDDAPVANKSITDTDIQNLLQTGVDNGQLPPPQPKMLYAVYFPTSTQISDFGGSACVDFLGYHFEMAIMYQGSPVDVSYAVLPRCVPFGSNSSIDIKNQLTITASHEFGEAAADPFPDTKGAYRMETNDAWVPSLGLGSAGNENGDVCIYAPAYDESGWKVQALWSNDSAKNSHEPCQPQPIASDPIYFNAAVRTDKQKINGHESYGYVVVPKGGSVDVQIDFFSTDKLPHDVNLYVGRDKGTGDPTDVDVIANGITAKLSRQSAHNGNGIVMTLSAPQTAVAGDFRFLVRSVLATNDFHDWPVIAHIE